MWVGSVEVSSADGKRRQKRVYGTTEGVALAKLQKLRNDIAKGLLPTSSHTKVAQWLNHWLETIKAPHVRPKTFNFYEEAVRLHITPEIGGKRLDRLTAEDVRAMLRQIPSTRNRQRAHLVLKLALKDAVTEGMLVRNVCDAVKKPEHVAKTRGAFIVDDAKHLIRTAIALEESPDFSEKEPRLATRWAAAFLTGARQAELLGLEWDRVDLAAGTINLSWQLQQLTRVHGCGGTCGRQRPSYCPEAKWDLPDGYEYRECYRSLVWTRPKTKTGTRVVDLLPGFVVMLKTHAQRITPNPYGLVWHYPDGKPVGPHDDYKRWRALLDAAELPKSTLHAARHATASMLQAHGVDEPTRMAIMGQSSVAAHRGYLHVDRTQTRAALQNLAELLP